MAEFARSQLVISGLAKPSRSIETIGDDIAEVFSLPDVIYVVVGHVVSAQGILPAGSTLAFTECTIRVEKFFKRPGSATPDTLKFFAPGADTNGYSSWVSHAGKCTLGDTATFFLAGNDEALYLAGTNRHHVSIAGGSGSQLVWGLHVVAFLEMLERNSP